MNRHLGLKPQAESCSPFGTKSDTSQKNMRTAFPTIGSEYSTLNSQWVMPDDFAWINFYRKLVQVARQLAKGIVLIWNRAERN
jgi:hypothetical protein